MTVRTVVLVDLAGYSDMQRLLEESLGVAAARDFDAQIQGFVGAALAVAGGNVADNVLMTTGDGAILAFDVPDSALDFAARLHDGVAQHNAGVTDAQAKRVFRVGIATGPLAYDEASGAPSGMTISRAARLEAKADLGGVLIDPETYRAASPPLRAGYRGPETVKGKREETFEAWRLGATVPVRVREAPKLSRAEMILRIHRDLSRLTAGQLVVLMSMLDIPHPEQPSAMQSVGDQAAAVLQWANREDCIGELADALRGILGSPGK